MTDPEYVEDDVQICARCQATAGEGCYCPDVISRRDIEDEY